MHLFHLKYDTVTLKLKYFHCIRMTYNKYKKYLNGDVKKPTSRIFRHNFDNDVFDHVTDIQDENEMDIHDEHDHQIMDDLDTTSSSDKSESEVCFLSLIL